MKRATVLRYSFLRVEASLAEGEEIEIVKGGKVVARLVPVAKVSAPVAIPDFVARLKETCGARLLNPSNGLACRRA